MSKTPTKRMVELLKALDAGKEQCHFMPERGRFNPNAYYFCFGMSGSSRCTREADGLVSRGLAEKANIRPLSGEHTLAITDAGRAFLATLQDAK